MKLPLRRLVTLSAVLSLTGLSADAAAKVGVLLKGKSAFWNAAEKGAMVAAEKYGVEVIVKAPPGETDVALQVQLFNALVNQGVDAIVIAPCSKDALKEATEAAAAKGIKIVVIDSALSGKASSTFVGTSQHAAGEAAGKLLAGLIAEKDEVTFLKHNQSSEATEQRERGALEQLRETYPKIVVHGDIYVASEKGVEDERAALVFSKYPGTKAVLATSTQGTMAMMKQLEAKKMSGKVKFIGFGFNLNQRVAAAIESGNMDVWIAQQPGEVAATGIQCALSLLKGETVPAVTNIDIAVITKANLKDPKIQALMVD
jgi:ribose transport system substrate-binding protein